MYKSVLFSKAVITATVCLILLMTAATLYLWHGTSTTKTGETTLDAPDTENTKTSTSEVALHDTQHHHGGASSGQHFGHIHTTGRRTPAHRFSKKEEDEIFAFEDKLALEVDSGAISRQEYAHLTRLYQARLATKGMSPFEALQYLLSYNGISAPKAYLEELADKALLENPENPEVLIAWGGQQSYRKEGPNPEAEAAYEKILAMDNVPPKIRRKTLDFLAGTVWYYKPEDAVRYIQEARGISEKDSLYYTQGQAYERLGTYDKAIEVYQDYHAQTGVQFVLSHIKAIEAGTPYIPPIERPTAPEQDGAQTPLDTEPVVSEPPDAPFVESQEQGSAPPSVDFADEDSRSAAAAAAAEYERLQAQQLEAFRQFITSEFPEYAELLDGTAELQELPKAFTDTPPGTAGMDGVDIGAKTDISKERIRAATQLLKQYGPDIALRRLRATEPALAHEIEKQLTRKPLKRMRGISG